MEWLGFVFQVFKVSSALGGVKEAGAGECFNSSSDPGSHSGVSHAFGYFCLSLAALPF